MITYTQLRNVAEKMNVVKENMQSLGLLPNMNQYTFAQVAVQNLLQQNRIMLCIPSGQGKTRVILTIPFVVQMTVALNPKIT